MFHLTYFLFTVKFWHFSSAAFVEKNRRTGTYASVHNNQINITRQNNVNSRRRHISEIDKSEIDTNTFTLSFCGNP